MIGVLAPAAHINEVGWREASFTLALGFAIASYGFFAYARPYVAVTDDAVVVSNVLSTVTIPYPRIAYVDTRWALEVYTDQATKVSAFAAPAPGVWTARNTKAGELKGLHHDTYLSNSARIGDKTGTASGDAAAMVREAVAHWRGAHPDALVDTATAPVRRRVNVASVATLMAVIGGFVVSFTL